MTFRPRTKGHKCLSGFLQGSFFRNRFCQVDAELTVDLVPRLLVWTISMAFKEQEAPTINQPVCDGWGKAIPGFTTDHIRFVGSTGNVKSR